MWLEPVTEIPLALNSLPAFSKKIWRVRETKRDVRVCSHTLYNTQEPSHVSRPAISRSKSADRCQSRSPSDRAIRGPHRRDLGLRSRVVAHRMTGQRRPVSWCRVLRTTSDSHRPAPQQRGDHTTAHAPGSLVILAARPAEAATGHPLHQGVEDIRRVQLTIDPRDLIDPPDEHCHAGDRGKCPTIRKVSADISRPADHNFADHSVTNTSFGRLPISCQFGPQNRMPCPAT